MFYNENEDQEPITTADTSNATKINSSEGTEPVYDKNGKMKWVRLSRINTGAADSFGNRDESVTRLQERAVAFDIISSHLELPDFYRREGRELMKHSIDTQTLSRPGSSVHLVSFCLAAHLINRDSIPRSYHPSRRDVDNDEHFLRVKHEFGFDGDMINSILQKIGEML